MHVYVYVNDDKKQKLLSIGRWDLSRKKLNAHYDTIVISGNHCDINVKILWKFFLNNIYGAMLRVWIIL